MKKESSDSRHINRIFHKYDLKKDKQKSIENSKSDKYSKGNK